MCMCWMACFLYENPRGEYSGSRLSLDVFLHESRTPFSQQKWHKLQLTQTTTRCHLGVLPLLFFMRLDLLLP
ncbi:hypothetical protein AALO_G00113610 [Alosa alosa]|uniref:Uncharacterized protein n=1 Tax=Alosa alosa TaxID=278164 RepID=A0AAV6GPR8_9TELE|nr:hypothetical protein AALO_G00113610 [Alosa alosa]